MLPVLHLLAMRDRGHANAGGIHECLNFCLYSNPPCPLCDAELLLLRLGRVGGWWDPARKSGMDIG